MSEVLHQLEGYWANAEQHLTNPVQFCLDRVLAAYEAPWRAHHNPEHILYLLEALQMLRPITAVDVWAAIYHDCVQDGESDDVAESAALARQDLTRMGAPEAMIAQTVAYIVATEQHEATGNAAIDSFLDADMAILAATPARYTEYAQAIRQEYAAYSDADFQTGRRAFLAGLLARDSIFLTPQAQADWEAAAQTNLRAELHRLQ